MHCDVPTIIIDPAALYREGLRRILNESNFDPIWCSDILPAEALPGVNETRAPLVIIGSKIEEAIEQAHSVKIIYPLSHIVFLVDSISKENLLMAMRSGSATVVLKRSSCEMFIGTLRLVLDGAAVFPADLIEAFLMPRIVPIVVDGMELASTARVDALPDLLTGNFGLSERELAVLRGLLEGLPNKEIARRLGITEATVKVHVKAILRKAHVRNRTQIALWASRLGLGAAIPAPMMLAS